MALIVGFAPVVVGVTAGVAEVDISTCGQRVSGKARLTSNLDCSLHQASAVTVVRGRLNMNGYSIVANSIDLGVGDYTSAIECLGKCVIVGPGSVTNGGSHGALHFRAGGKLRGIIISDCPGIGVLVERGRLVLDGVRVERVVEAGVLAAQARKIVVKNSVIADNGRGVLSSFAPLGFRAKVVIKNTQVSGNEGDGVSARKVTVAGGSVTSGNGALPAAPGCAQTDFAFEPGQSPLCADVVSVLPPRLSARARCGTSLNMDRSLAWGVCDLD